MEGILISTELLSVFSQIPKKYLALKSLNYIFRLINSLLFIFHSLFSCIYFLIIPFVFNVIKLLIV